MSAIGLNAPATAAAQRAEIAGFTDHPYMIARDGKPYVLASVPSLKVALAGVERYRGLMLPALKEALQPLSDHSRKMQSVNAIVGLPEARPGIPTQLSSLLREDLLSLHLPGVTIEKASAALLGHSAGSMAIESAFKRIKAGRDDFCVIGGVDSYVDADTLDWIENNDQLHTPVNAWGFIPGEAAAFCLICTASTAVRHKLSVKARILSVRTEFEPNRIKTETVCVGKAMSVAVDTALQKLPQDKTIDQTYCDQNGEAYRADEFGFMLSRLSSRFDDPGRFVAAADCWGDIGAASGPMSIMLACSAFEKQYNYTAYALVLTGSEVGHRTAVVLMRPFSAKEAL